MADRVSLIAGICLLLLVSGLSEAYAAVSSLNGSAELSYVKYNSESYGREILDGSSFAQKYRILYRNTNLTSSYQQKYYLLNLGYELFKFDTRTAQPGQDTDISDTFGRFIYNGDIFYDSNELPIKFRLYANNNVPLSFFTASNSESLLENNLVLNINGHGNVNSVGGAFTFDPMKGRRYDLRRLPGLVLEFRQLTVDNTFDVNKVYQKDRMFTADIFKENNWLRYNVDIHEDLFDSKLNYTRQKIQLGMIDNVGRRHWANLTNWIDVSADGQVVTRKSPEISNNSESYDLNFMATARRRTWEARTFANYYRRTENNTIDTGSTLPLYLKGTNGPDTDWFLSYSNSLASSKNIGVQTRTMTYTNSVTLGATLYKRALFQLSPSASLLRESYSDRNDLYEAMARIEAASTPRFSSKSALAASITLRGKDDGQNNPDSKSWSALSAFTGTYRASSALFFRLDENLDIGNGTGYLYYGSVANNSVINSLNTTANATANKVGSYLHNATLATVGWTPTAALSTGLLLNYDYSVASGSTARSSADVVHDLAYQKNIFSYKVRSKFNRSSSALGTSTILETDHSALFRPDRYNDGSLQYVYRASKDSSSSRSGHEVIQKYKRKFYTTSGVIRELASLSEEFYYGSGTYDPGVTPIRSAVSTLGNISNNSTTRYLTLSGIFNPTAKLGFSGSFRKQYNSLTSNTLYYDFGVNTNFQLLSASLTYAHVKRDIDNRIEKRLDAKVSRGF